jgi:nicotinamidase-related amidase
MVTFAIDPRKSAVVAIDLQNCNVEKSPIAAPLGLQVVDKLNLLAAHYRAAGSTIIWTRHSVRPDHSDVGILGKTVPPVAQGVIDVGRTSPQSRRPSRRYHFGEAAYWQFPSNGARNDLACSRD